MNTLLDPHLYNVFLIGVVLIGGVAIIALYYGLISTLTLMALALGVVLRVVAEAILVAVPAYFGLVSILPKLTYVSVFLIVLAARLLFRPAISQSQKQDIRDRVRLRSTQFDVNAKLMSKKATTPRLDRQFQRPPWHWEGPRKGEYRRGGND